MNDLTGMAAQLAEALTETMDDQRISYLDVLDALASAGVTLAPDTDGEVSRAYATAAEMEGQWAA
jgi:hypothetical protein